MPKKNLHGFCAVYVLFKRNALFFGNNKKISVNHLLNHNCSRLYFEIFFMPLQFSMGGIWYHRCQSSSLPVPTYQKWFPFDVF